MGGILGRGGLGGENGGGVGGRRLGWLAAAGGRGIAREEGKWAG